MYSQRPNMLFEATTFCGCGSPYETSRFVIFGVPFDGQASFRPGARFGPSAMRRDSWGLESYSPLLDRDLEDIGVTDLGDLELPCGSVTESLLRVQQAFTTYIEDGKIPVMVGGDHSMTLAGIRAVAKQYETFHVIHLDAHTDLREDYLGDPFSHGSVMRRAHELLGNGRIHSFGVRSGLREEFAFAREHLYFYPFTLDQAGLAIDVIGEAPVYVTIDLDILDPSVCPGTGTPEPDGVSFSELRRALSIFGKLRVVATDIMELSPPCDLSGASTAVACKLLREWLLMIK
ncbi:MAG TPA: agmatinase [Clostridiaceae bacterium]|nr:agmatinase [Clostridiaceae bacterium]